MLGSILLLSALTIADRLTAWLIGEFPTYVPWWQLRFEFLRPIGVYYDMVERNYGAVSPRDFSLLALGVAVIIAAGVLSRVRLARALACHLTFGVAALLGFVSWNPGFALRSYGEVGMTSQPYALLGLAVAMISAGLCARIHAEYVGWNPASSRLFRRTRIAGRRMRSRLGASAAELVDQIDPIPGRARASMVAARTQRQNNRDR